MAERIAGRPAPDAGSSRVGEYEILEELAKSAAAVTYRARGPLLPERDLALTEIRAAGGDAQRRMREARALERVSGLHVAMVHEVFEVPERSSLCVVSDLPGGERLSDRLERRSLEPGEIVSVLDGILDALEAMHGAVDDSGQPAPIVHRDLKPSNVAFQPWRDGEVVKVTAFGIARVADDGRRIEQALESLEACTPAYAAPEVLFGEIASPAADIWSAGVILWEMLAGRNPFGGADGRVSSPAQLLIQHQGVLPPLPEDARARAGEKIAELVRDLCAHDPALRPTARQARDRLARASLPGELANEVAATRSSGARWSAAGPPRSSGSRRGRALVALAVIAAVLCIAGGALLLVAGMLPERPAPYRAPWPSAAGSTGPITSSIAAPPVPTAAGPTATSMARGPVTAAAAICPELATADPSVAALPAVELERRLLIATATAPGQAARRIEALRARASTVEAERRDCAYRALLIGALAGRVLP